MPLLAEALDVTPFYSRPQSPVEAIFGLPAAGDAVTVPKGRTDLRLVLEASNNFSKGWSPEPNESLLLDGETYRSTLVFRHGLLSNLDIGLDIPYVAHNEGVADGWIKDFHDLIGLVKNQRNGVEKNRLTYHYLREGETKFKIEKETSGLGDIQISCGIKLFQRPHPASRAMALRATLKLPTGDHDRLLGSGSTDFALHLSASDSASLSAWNLTYYGAFGGLLIGDAKVLKDQQRDFVAFGTFGLGWQPRNWLVVKVQVDAQSSFYRKSHINTINSGSAQLIGGATFALPFDTSLDLGILEPVFVETPPDVALHLALRKRF